MDALRAGLGAVHYGNHRGGAALWHCPAARWPAALEEVADRIFAEDLADRVLPFDRAAAHEFADIAASRRRAGRPISQADARIAAIAGRVGPL